MNPQNTNECNGYISDINDKFFAAIQRLNMYKQIAVHGLMIEDDLGTKLSLLGIGTEKEAYIFDIELIGSEAFYLGLKYLLEAEDIGKTMFNSMQMLKCLREKYDTNITSLLNIFEIQVADYIVKKGMNESAILGIRSLSDIIKDYCNPSPTMEPSEPDNNELAQRPLSMGFLKNYALNIAYLYELKNILHAIQINMGLDK